MEQAVMMDLVSVSTNGLRVTAALLLVIINLLLYLFIYLFIFKGGMVGSSDHEPFLMLSNLINGTYNFTLMVTNSNGKINTDNVTVTVKEGNNY